MESISKKRSLKLQEKLNHQLNHLAGKQNHDFCSSMSQEDFINLKMAISDINNILTLKLTLSAINWLSSYFGLTIDHKNRLIENAENTNSNTNGFDIIFDDSKKFIAEVKCNVPSSKGSRYLAAQRNSILDDALKLFNGKRSLKNSNEFFKFIFLLDLGERSDKAINSLLSERNTRSENQQRIDRNNVVKKMSLLADKTPDSLNKQTVYIVSIEIK